MLASLQVNPEMVTLELRHLAHFLHYKGFPPLGLRMMHMIILYSLYLAEVLFLGVAVHYKSVVL